MKADDRTTNNGILPRVPGPFITRGASTLPRAGDIQEEGEARQATVEPPELGYVSITYVLRSYRQGRNRLWHWVATRADFAPVPKG